jgi:hypothetical protein
MKMRDGKTVAVDDQWLVFHDPRNLACTHGLIETTVGMARRNGAVPCTACFEDATLPTVNIGLNQQQVTPGGVY